MCGCLLRGPHWGPGLQPRHVPWLGIELVTLWFIALNLLSYTSQGCFLCLICSEQVSPRHRAGMLGLLVVGPSSLAFPISHSSHCPSLLHPFVQTIRFLLSKVWQSVAAFWLLCDRGAGACPSPLGPWSFLTNIPQPSHPCSWHICGICTSLPLLVNPLTVKLTKRFLSVTGTWAGAGLLTPVLGSLHFLSLRQLGGSGSDRRNNLVIKYSPSGKMIKCTCISLFKNIQSINGKIMKMIYQWGRVGME